MSGPAIASQMPVREGKRTDADDRLRIAIGLEGLALGGCPINAIDLGRRMRDRGHEVALFAIDEDVPVTLLPVAERAGFEVAVLPAVAGGLGRSQQIRRFAQQNDAQIIHVYGPWLGPAASVAAVGRRRRACVVTNWTMENVDYTPAQATLILGTRRLEVEAAQLHRGSVQLLEPPVDLDADQPNAEAAHQFRSEWQIDQADIALVVVSRLDTEMKAESIGHAIRTLPVLNDPRVRLVVVGDGDARPALEREAELINSGLGRRAVIFTGALHDPRPAYDAADITLCMGGSALRALAHAKPLVVVGINGFAKTFEVSSTSYFYENGFFGVDATDDPVDRLRTEIVPLLERRRRDELARLGAAEVRQRFGLEVSARRLETIYRDALTRSASTPVRVLNGLRTGSRIAAHDLKHRVRGAAPRPRDARRRG